MSIEPPQATLYVWVPVIPGYSQTEFISLLLGKCGIMVNPWQWLWCRWESFFRIALTIPDERMHEAIQPMKDAEIRYA